MQTISEKGKSIDSLQVDHNWNEAELSDFWMVNILRNAGWGTTSNSLRFMKKETRSSLRERIDFTLHIGTRSVACIELKSPKLVNFLNPQTKRACLSQASKYALSKYKYHHGAIVAPLGVLTNGLHAFVFDGGQRFQHVLDFHSSFTLANDSELQAFLQIFTENNFDLEKGFSKNYILRTPIEETQWPPTKSADAQLSIDILNIYENICRHSAVNQKSTAFLGTISLMILSVFRDCGLYPNDRIQALLAKKNKTSWEFMIDDLSKIMQHDLSILKSPYCEASWDFYEDTTRLCVNLATFPAAGLGRAYEDLLQKVAKKGNTSFYTPEELIKEILDEVNPGVTDRILDPTCGSAAFLATVIERIIVRENLNAAQARQYIEQKIFGVDRDWFACQIARASIIAVYAKLIPYHDQGENKLQSPQVNTWIQSASATARPSLRGP